MKEITGIFKNKEDLDLAFEELNKIGIKKENINLLAREKEIRIKLGKDYSSVYDLNDKVKVPRMRYVSEKSFYSRENIFITVSFYIGIIIALITTISMHESIGIDIAVAFFAGMLLQTIGILIAGIFRKRHGDYIEKKLDKGGFIFWIQIKDDKNIKNKAFKILRKYSAKAVHVVNEN